MCPFIKNTTFIFRYFWQKFTIILLDKCIQDTCFTFLSELMEIFKNLCIWKRVVLYHIQNGFGFGFEKNECQNILLSKWEVKREIENFKIYSNVHGNWKLEKGLS